MNYPGVVDLLLIKALFLVSHAVAFFRSLVMLHVGIKKKTKFSDDLSEYTMTYFVIQRQESDANLKHIWMAAAGVAKWAEFTNCQWRVGMFAQH